MAGRVSGRRLDASGRKEPVRNGITRRWMLNGLAVVVLLLLIFEIAFMAVTRSLSYQSVRANLHLRAAAYNQQIDRYMESEDFKLESSARQLVEQFTDKEKMELQIIGASGHILVSSTGFTPSETNLPDYKEALTSDKSTGIWNGANSNGENVMALSRVVTDSSGKPAGALRYVVSLAQVDRQILMTLLMTLAIGMVIICLVMLSNLVFINSIIRPIAGIGQAARRIALGDYDAHIQKTHDDEIGDLCDTINYMAEEIADAERLKNEFISSISHELRTPLTAIKGWSETLRQGALTDTQLTAQGLDVISNEAERLSGIVEELLDFSRMQSGHMVMRFNRMDLSAELEEVAFLLRDRAAREQVELHYVPLEQPLPPVLGDRDRLRQVFINVLDNAIKYSSNNGLIRMEAADMGSHVQVVISDNGIGIAKEDLANIKTKFYRANKTRSGSGIGLALADEIIRRHNGRLDIDSELGVGTTVTITLPAAPDA